MKFTPFHLFILLLIILVITVIICRNCNNNIEGFSVGIGALSEVQIEGYWGDSGAFDNDTEYKVTRLNDYLYFDTNNGNLIEVVGTLTGGTMTVTELHVTTRQMENTIGIKTGQSTQSCIPSVNACAPATNPSMNDTFASYIYNSKVTIDGDVNSASSYVVLYIPWGTDTYIHVIKQSDVDVDNEHRQSFTFTANESTVKDVNVNLITLTPSSSSTSYGGNVNLTSYNADINLIEVYRHVYFDVKNANLIVKPASDIVVYDSNLAEIPKENVVECTRANCITTNVNFNSLIINDSSDKYIVIAMRFGKQTVISIINKPLESRTIELINVARFDETGLVTGVVTGVNDAADDAADDGADDGGIEYDNDDLSDYPHEYDRNTPYSGRHNSRYLNNSDYILKSKIVPPVCPSCPKCPDCNTNGICTNCGGNGGNGTLKTQGKSLVGETGNVLSNTVNATGHVAAGVVNAAGQVASGVVDATGNIVANTVDATGNVVANTVGATGNVISGTVGATTDLLKSAGSGIAGLLDSNKQSTNAQVPPTQSKPVLDPYSYQGQLSNRPSSTYLPITSNFSAFGR